MASDLARTAGDRHRRPDMRGRARRQLRSLRRRPRRPGHRPERLRRDGPRPLGVGPAAARRLPGARRAGRPGAAEDIVPGGGPRRGGRLPAHHAAAGETAGAGGVERHRGRGTGLAHRRPRPASARWSGSREKARANTSGRSPRRSTEPTEDGARRFADAPRRCCGACPTREARGGRPAPWSGYLGHALRGPPAAAGPVRGARRRLPCGRHRQRGHPVVRRAAPGPPGRTAGAPGEGGPRLGAAAAPGRQAGFEVPEVAHEGRRVVLGQKQMQVVSDMLLGWTVGRRAALPGAAVQEPQGQRGPGGPGRRGSSTTTAG